MLHKLLIITATAFFLMQVNPLWAKESRKSVSPFSSKAIWNPPDTLPGEIFGRCASINTSYEGPSWINCIASGMRTAGASSDTIRVVELLDGQSYLIEFREFGQVDLAVVSAFSYNSPELSHQEILVNGTPTLVDPLSKTKDIDIRKDPLYRTLIRKFSKADLWSLYNFQTAQKLPEGGQRFVFNFTLLNGCRGCDIAGSAKIGFEFDKTGRFTISKLLGLKVQ